MINYYLIHLVGSRDDVEYKLVDQNHWNKVQNPLNPKGSSPENDEALNTGAITLNGEEACFSKWIDLKTFMDKHSINIIDAYGGMIY